MDARLTWQALQAHLKAARSAADAGDREHALAEINAALAIDPDFLAAQSLRDLVLASETTLVAPARTTLVVAPAQEPTVRLSDLPTLILGTDGSTILGPDGSATAELDATPQRGPFTRLPSGLPYSAAALKAELEAADLPVLSGPMHHVDAKDAGVFVDWAAVDGSLRSVAATEADAAVPADSPTLSDPVRRLASQEVAASKDVAIVGRLPVASESSVVAAGRPLAPTDGYAKFEQRARRRRVDGRLDAAREAISAGRLRAAATALDEVIDLDPNLPDLGALTAEFDLLRRTTAAVRRGPRFAAAAVFAGTLLGASWLHDSTSPLLHPQLQLPRPLLSRPMLAFAPLVALPMSGVTPSPEPPGPAAAEHEPAMVAAAEREPADSVPSPERDAVAAVATTEREPAAVVATAEREPAARVPAVETASARPAPVPPPPAVSPADAVEVPRKTEPAAVMALRSPAPPAFREASAVAPVATPTVPPGPAPAVDDNFLVTQTLQRYRSAFGGLDAQSARAVWPAVDQAALARAFNGLESQSLTFDACDVRVRGEAANVTCRGSARYVPKVGSREPHVEPRVWTFTLQKNDGDWKIDSARAER